ncbi:copper resistance protein CopC [Mycolicibacterium sp. Y3]
MAGSALVMLALTLLTAPMAHAHAVLVTSTPIDGARLVSSPPSVTLTFDEPVRLIPEAVLVISDTGTRVDTGPSLRSDGATIDLPLLPNLPRGSYTATWRVISADTHEVSGSISFGIGQDPSAAGGAQSVDDRLGWISDAVRGLIYLGLVFGFGTGVCVALLWPWVFERRPARALVLLGLVLVGCATVLQLLLAGPRALGLDWAGVFDAAGLRQTLRGAAGAVASVRLIGIAAWTATLWRWWQSAGTGAPPYRLVLVGVGAALGVVGSVAVEGHSGVGADVWLAAPAAALHILAMSVWMGGLVVLTLFVLPSDRVDQLNRWSVTAFLCLVVLVLTGEYQAWRQVAPVEALWSTSYGITLLVKLIGVTAMVVLAYLGRRRLSRKVLRRTVPVEAVIGIGVLVVTTLLVAQPPARTVYGPPVALTAPLDAGRTVHIEVSSTRRGPIDIDLTVLDAGGTAVRVQNLAATLASTDAGIASLPVRWSPAIGSVWRSSYAVAPRPGTWTLNLTVGFTATEVITTTTTFHVW